MRSYPADIDSLRVLLVDGSTDIARIGGEHLSGYALVVCLCWLDPGTREGLEQGSGGAVVSIYDGPEGMDALDRRAWQLIRTITSGGLQYLGLGIDGYMMAEPVSFGCMRFAAAEMALDIVEAHLNRSGMRDASLEHALSGPVAGILKILCQDSPRYRLSTHRAARHRNTVYANTAPFPLRVWRRVRSMDSPAKAAAFFRDSLERLDRRYAIRAGLARFGRSGRTEKGGVTFLSSYANNTRMLKLFEGLMPGDVEWVLCHHSALGGLDRRDRRRWLWSAGRREVAFDEAGDSGGEIEARVRGWRDSDAAWQADRKACARLVPVLTGYWESYLDEARPALVAVSTLRGGIDTWLASVAAKRGVPVVSVMHGMFYRPYIDVRYPMPDGLYVVPGEFWRGMYPEDRRHDIMVCNPSFPPGDKVAHRREGRRKRLTFFSWPLHRHFDLSGPSLFDGLARMFSRLIRDGYDVAYRPHPLEDPSFFLHRCRGIDPGLPGRIIIDRGGAPGGAIAASDVALMFNSTTLFQCMDAKVPVVLMGWIEPFLSPETGGMSGVGQAKGFEDMESLIRQWMEDPPAMPDGDGASLVAPPGTGVEELKCAIEKLVSGRV